MYPLNARSGDLRNTTVPAHTGTWDAGTWGTDETVRTWPEVLIVGSHDTAELHGSNPNLSGGTCTQCREHVGAEQAVAEQAWRTI